MTFVTELIAGIVLMALAGLTFFYCLPRGGRTARFVGTEWEAYCVVAMIGTFGIGAILLVAAFTPGI